MRQLRLFTCSLAILSLVTFSLSQLGAAEKARSEPDTATSPQTVVYDAASAFEFLKTLTGDWEQSGNEHDHGGKNPKVSFRLTAAGSAVMETIFEGSPMEMITVFHMDGDTLLLTHYYALQNAPVLKFVKSDKPGEIKFEFHGGTNFDPKSDVHVHEGVMQVKDANTIDSSFVAFSDGKPSERPHGVLKRAGQGRHSRAVRPSIVSLSTALTSTVAIEWAR